MTLSIALGGVTTSSSSIVAPFSASSSVNDFNDSNDEIHQPLYNNLAYAVCPQKEWQAQAVTSFYDVIKDQTDTETPQQDRQRQIRESTVVEIAIQISYLCRPLLGLQQQRQQERKYRFKLMDGAYDLSYPQYKQPQVLFTHDRKHIVLLLFHPHQHSPAVILFQLRRPRSNSSSLTQSIPIPSYIAQTNQNHLQQNNNNNNGYNSTANDISYIESQREPPAVVATNPKLVSVWGITAICSIPTSMTNNTTTATTATDSTVTSRSMILAICQNATLVWIDVKSGQVIATGTLPITVTSQNILPITSIQASPISSLEHGTAVLVSSAAAATNTRAARTNEMDSDENDTHSTSKAECILLEWSIKSTTPIQRTFLKRASTGTVTVSKQQQQQQSSPSPSEQRQIHTTSIMNGEEFQMKGTKDRIFPQRTFSDPRPRLRRMLSSSSLSSSSAPSPNNSQRIFRRKLRKGSNKLHVMDHSRTGTNEDNNSTSKILFRSKSMERNAKDFAEKLNFHKVGNMISNVKNNKSNGNATEQESEQEAKQRRKQYALQQLQKPTRVGSWWVQQQMKLFSTEEPTSSIQASARTHVNTVTPFQPNRQLLKRSSSVASMIHSAAANMASSSPRASSTSGNDDSHINGEQSKHRRLPRRRSNPDKNNTTEQKMNVSVLSTWSGSDGNDQGEHAHPNSQKIVIDATFGALASSICVLYQSSVTERRQRMAQVLTVNETGRLIPVVSLFLSLEQVEQAKNIFSLDLKRDNIETAGTDTDMIYEEYETQLHEHPSSYSERHLFGVEYDTLSDNFVVSSIFGKHTFWLGCTWNWRSNAIGWMIQRRFLSSLTWSRLYVGRDFIQGSHLIQIDCISDLKLGKNIKTNSPVAQTRKGIIPLGYLSPSNSYVPGPSESCSLLLANNYIAFPSVTKISSNTKVSEVGWKTFAVPSSYCSSYGPPRIAAITPTNAKAIAVASRRGLCLLDARLRYKWKEFGTPSDEKLFSVLAMTWWEGQHFRKKSNDETDDLLMALVQTSSGQQYLSCWSSRKLTLAHQLLDTPEQVWNAGETQELGQSWGIALPGDIRATNISLLAEPHSQNASEKMPRRAVLLVYAADQHTSEFDYFVFRLQVCRNNLSKVQSESDTLRKQYFVMGHEVLRGKLKNGMRSVGPVTSIYVAGAWFRFDLRKLKKRSSKKIDNEEEYAATLGVIRSSSGIESLCLARNGKAWIATVINTEISKYWLSDIVHSNELLGVEGPPSVSYAWVLQCLHGELFSWSVPSIMTCHSGQLDEWQMSSAFHEARVERPKALCLPSLVCRRDSRDEKKRWLLGTICELGNASDWVQQSSSGSHFDISLGHVPESEFGCILRAGQSLQSFSRNSSDEIDAALASTTLDHNDIYSQGSFLMVPPAFVTSLYILLLETASLRTEIPVMESSDPPAMTSVLDVHKHRLETLERHIQYRLTTDPNKDAVMMGLRMLILRSVEVLAKMHKMHSIEQAEDSESNVLLSLAFFSATVDAIRCCTTNLQFASLFLEVGRQIEPSCLTHLFPLPLPDEGSSLAADKSTSASTEEVDSLDRFNARSVLDLFTLSIDEGSLGTSTSALPLFASKALARHYCGILLDDAIDCFIRNSKATTIYFDVTEEERRVIGDIFRFGMKLEDAELLEEDLTSLPGEGIKLDLMDDSTVSVDNTIASRTTAEESDFIHSSPKNSNLICGMNGNSTILNYIVPSSIRGETDQQKEENAIRREASSFIKYSLDDPASGFATLPDWNDDRSSSVRTTTDINSVGGVIGDALLDLLQNTTTDNNWKAMSALAKMLLQDNNSISFSFELFGCVAVKVQPADILSFLPESYDVFGQNCNENLIEYLMDQNSTCRKQVSESGAMAIVDMALLILSRIQKMPLHDTNDHAVMELGLVLIIMISAYNCRRSLDVCKSMKKGSLLEKCYHDVVHGPDEGETGEEESEDNEDDLDDSDDSDEVAESKK